MNCALPLRAPGALPYGSSRHRAAQKGGAGVPPLGLRFFGSVLSSRDVGVARVSFNTRMAVLLVSLGVDTYAHDPVVFPGTGFALELPDYFRMGQVIREMGVPTVVVQEGGYALDVVGTAVANVLKGLAGPTDKPSKLVRLETVE
eukprot:1190992-Prorocentrum_minimum.AAC.4